MVKDFLSVMVCAVIVLSASLGTVEARKVYIDELDSGTKIYVDDDSIYGEPEKFTVTLYFDDEATTAIFSQSGFLAMAIIGGQAMMVNGNDILEEIFSFCQDQF